MNFLASVLYSIPDSLQASMSFANSLAGIWVPILLGVIALEVFVHYKRNLFLSKLDRIVLEIRAPKEIFKSPAAMEVVLNGVFFQTGGDKWDSGLHWYDRYVTGKQRPWFSLEIVSQEGRIAFLIWTEKKFKPLIEAQFYAQYPEVEIREVPDYIHDIPFGVEGTDWSMHGVEFKLSEKDKDTGKDKDGLPIKTYVDYGLQKDPKEEYKIDPMTPLLELMGGLGKNEHMWFQVLIRGTKKYYKADTGLIFPEARDWKKEAEELLKKTKGDFKKLNEGADGEAGKIFSVTTDEQKRILDNLERNMRKNGFETIIRLVYLAKKDNFRGTLIGGILGALKQFASEGLNSFSLATHTGVDYWYQDMEAFRNIPILADTFGKNMPQAKKDMFQNYKERAMNYSHGVGGPFILTSEELATVYHIPGQVAETPTFERIESKRSEPPANLPL